MDDVFKALADPTRRSLLDELYKEDGQTLSALEQRLPMTRFGVMKHLKLLEDAGLVTTQRRGREKLHFLNPVPIRLVHDRWVSKYAEPWAAALSGLKRHFEEETMEKVYEVYVRATPERVWHALTDTETRAKWTFGWLVESDYTPGSTYVAKSPDGSEVWIEGENLEVDPPRRLVQTFDAHWDAEVDVEPPTTMTWEIDQFGETCRVRVTHAGLTESTSDEIYGGTPMILSALKTLLETGEALALPGPPPDSLGRPKTTA